MRRPAPAVRPLPVRRDARGVLVKAWPAAVAGEVYAVEIRPGASRGHHLHRRGGEWFVPLGGRAVLVVADPADGRRWEIPLAGVRAWVPAGLAHAIFALGEAPAWVLAVADRRPDDDETVPHPLDPPGDLR